MSDEIKFTPEFIAEQRKIELDSRFARDDRFTKYARQAMCCYPVALDEIERLRKTNRAMKEQLDIATDLGEQRFLDGGRLRTEIERLQAESARSAAACARLLEILGMVGERMMQDAARTYYHAHISCQTLAEARKWINEHPPEFIQELKAEINKLGERIMQPEEGKKLMTALETIPGVTVDVIGYNPFEDVRLCVSVDAQPNPTLRIDAKFPAMTPVERIYTEMIKKIKDAVEKQV
jgi:hypothetical protein